MRTWCGAIVVAAGVTVLTQAQTTPSVTVQVVAAETGRPIPNALVRVVKPYDDTLYDRHTDAKGVVSYSSLRPERYHVEARAAGYRWASYGDALGLGETLVSVKAGSAPVDITIALHRGGTIAGIVTNDLKEPVVDAEVHAIRRRSIEDRRFVASDSVKTDDHGAYRIIGLEVAEYFVSATDGLSVAFATTPRASTAPRPIGVLEDAEVAGVNIQTRPAPAGRITGSIAGPGAGAPGMSVSLMQEAGPLGFIPVTSARTQPGARFEIADVPVGRYVLVVRPGSSQGQPRAWARTAVVVAANAETTATLPLRSGGRVSGTVTGPAGVQLVPIGTDHPEAAVASAALVNPGSFIMANLAPGRYRWMRTPMMFTSPPDSVLSVFVDGQDVTDVPIDIAADTAIENVRVTVTPGARVSGSVLDSTGKTTSRGAVIVASTNPRDWTEATRRIRLARPDTAGFYEISGLPPGSYTVSTVTALLPGQLWDAVFLKTVAKARQITLSQAQTTTLDLRLK